MMKLLFTLGVVLALGSCASMKNTGDKISGDYSVSCGMCNFAMTGDECSLAIQIDGKAYYVEGSTLIEHGDEHAADGMCEVVRKATVVGEIKKGVFVAESITMLPYKP